jgi:tRNA (guanine37-N1)-methyltransferase
MSGHHAQIERWRREQRLLRTARRRPDLIERLDPHALPAADLAVLGVAGWAVVDGRFQPVPAAVAD